MSAPNDDRDLPIIDAHHHYWDVPANPHPWLVDEPMIPFRYGDYSSIRKPFLPPDYDAIAKGHNVVSTVTMEGEWDDDDLVAESRWISQLAADTGRPAAHVARTFLHRADAPEELAAHAAFPLVRGIRHKPAAAPSPDKVERGAPASMSDPAWQRGYAALAPNGLHFELQTPWWHVDELLDLVARFPGTPVVINHCFMPSDRSAAALAGWTSAIRKAASAPNITIKISGFGIPGRPWSLDDNQRIIDTIIAAFGAERAMFASNFPVDGLCASFDTIYTGFKQATRALPDADRRKLFHDTAVRIYRLDMPMVG